MLYLEILRMAWRGIIANKLRTVLTMLGIVVGVGTVILLIAYSKGAEAMLLENFEKWGSNRMGGYINRWRGGASIPASVYFKLEDIENFRGATNYVSYASGVVETKTQVRYLNSNLDDHSLLACDPEYQEIANMELAEGRWFTAEENIMRDRVCVLGSETKQNLFFSAPALDRFVMVGGKRYRVVGVLESKGSSRWQNPDEQVVIPLLTGLDRMAGIDKRSMGVSIQLTDSTLSEEAEEHFIAMMHEANPNVRRPLNPEVDRSPFSFWSAAEWQAEREATAKSLSGFLLITGLMSLLIGSVGVMNIMLVTVQERTKEIGLRKALGASRRSILGQFLIETGVICAMGGLIGTLFAVVTSQYLARLPEEAQVPDPIITTAAILLAVGITAAVALAAGMYPAIRAATLDPVRALGYD